MKYSIFGLFIIIFLSLAVAFPVENYLLPGEKKETIVLQNITINGNFYSVVNIESRDVMLLKNDNITLDKNEISYVLKTYYKSKFSPTTSDFQKIKDLLTAYNESRNDGTLSRKGKEENACRDALFLNGQVKDKGQSIYCTDEASCKRIGTLVYITPAYNGVLKSVSVEAVVAYVRSFASASDGTEKLMHDNFDAINNINEDNIGTNLNIIKNSTSNLTTYKNAIETTKFRDAKRNAMGTYDSEAFNKCRIENCFGICPSLDFNLTALNSLNTNVSELLDKTGPLSNYLQIAYSISDGTRTRLDFFLGQTKGTYYSVIFDPLSIEAKNTIQKADDLSANVLNGSFQLKVGRLKELNQIINISLTYKNFTKIEDDINEYRSLINDIKDAIPNIAASYKNAVNTRKRATNAILLLSSKDLDDQPKKRLLNLSQTIISIDDSFVAPLAQEDYDRFTSVYLIAINESASIDRMQSNSIATSLFSKLRSMARNTNKLINGFLRSAKISPENAIKNRELFFGGISLFVFLSISSAIIFLILLLSAVRSINKALKMFLTLFLFVLIIISLVFSAIFYTLLDKTATSAQAHEFLSDVKNKNTFGIVVDLTQVPEESAAQMIKCSETTKDSFEMKNKTIITYKYSGETCTSKDGSKPLSKCLAEIESYPSIVLKYSSDKKPPVFTNIYDAKAYLFGNKNHYLFCSFSEILDS